ncbi:MAG: putative 1L-myo-inositol-phosphate synthase [Thermoleophilia bacterium]|nr:putative 1L-myo-inositol-phosphate synthase [Thermoleophilia bacterium]MCZ4497334.1 putative 1L-myo-inositol-phosphate synthase [Thermoleophilia bacterium]
MTSHNTNKVRVAIAGVGNCASSLIQGVTHYAGSTGEVPGLMHSVIGGYGIEDIEFVAAFDVADAKVGKDLAEAIFSGENNTVKFSEVAPAGVTVQRGPTLDGIGKYLSEVVELSAAEPVDVAQVLRDTKTDVLINLLPVGSQQAVEFYAEAALAAGTGFVNCIPVFIAGRPEWRARFEEANLPIIGDDIKSQVGATILHRRIAQLFRDRGVKILRTSQLNVGGNSDFRNMLERERLESKKISKTNAVTSVLPYELPAKDVYVGPSDYVPWLEDRKWAHIRVEGEAFGGVPLNMEIKLEVVDSPNSAGITIDAVRMAKYAMDRGIGGALEWSSAYLMKSPPWQHDDDIAREQLEAFLTGGTPGREVAERGTETRRKDGGIDANVAITTPDVEPELAPA